MTMAKITVHIPHCVWRDGRPRFVPGPGLRKLGFTGRDLRHGPTGPWFSLDEATAESARIVAEVGERRGRKAGGAKRLPPVRKPPGYFTLAELFDEVERSPRFGSLRRKGKPPSEETKTWYRQQIATLKTLEPDLFALSIVSFRKSDMFNLSERLESARGVATMRAIMATVSRAFSYAAAKGRIDANPCHDLSLPTSPKRVRAGNILEIATLIAAATHLGRHDAADMIAFAVTQGQRQRDRFAFVPVAAPEGTQAEGRIFLKQGKRGAIVAIRPATYLRTRLEAAALRRAAAQARLAEVDARYKRPTALIPRNLFMNEDAYSLGVWRPWGKKTWADVYKAVRDTAVRGIPDQPVNGEPRWKVPPCPSVADLRDQDFRDTHATWVTNAGGSVGHLRSTMGLSLQSLTQTLEHYMAIDPEQADSAMALLDTWIDKRNETSLVRLSHESTAKSHE